MKENELVLADEQNEHNGPRAKKSLGQNFLQDKNIAAKIVAALNIQESDKVLEIGPGAGALSSWVLAKKPAFFCMLEKDRHWAEVRSAAALKEVTSASVRSAAALNEVSNKTLEAALKSDQEYCPNVAQFASPVVTQVILSDAMNVDWSRFKSPWKFIGNLPYNVASPIMWDLLSLATGLEAAVFMVQKEVADRLVAPAGSKVYGALSAWVQSFTKTKILFNVPPQVFVPRPKVMSAVVSFMPLPLSERPNDLQGLNKLLAFCFQRRRKQIQNIMRELVGDKSLIILEQCGFNPCARPETFSPKDFQRLLKVLKSETNA